ncbi:Mitochondrial beta-keto-acyl synthase [Collariella sp. IMI 366227]|nr:Mitochondrial beta-keto-acyl synthase [Collariella sp. IMI 366227]
MGLGHGFKQAPALALALILALVPNCDAQNSNTPGTLKLPWTTDPSVIRTYPNDLNATQGRYGPDGPWQAIALMTRDDTVKNGVVVPVWPTSSAFTELISVMIGGGYKAPNSSRDLIGWVVDGSPQQLHWGGIDYWLGQYFGRYDHAGGGYYDNITFMTPGADHKVRAAVFDTYLSNHMMVNGANYTSKVGTLGLAHVEPQILQGSKQLAEELKNHKSILQVLQEEGKIESDFWSLHMGSVPMGQIGSAYLGGYEQNRALGPVGVFNPDSTIGMFMTDVFLGVEVGHSPFNFSASEVRSVWQEVQNPASEEVWKMLGGAAGTVFMTPATTSPGIYLPPGFCEAAASYLPVTWHKQSGYYHWNTADPNYARIVNSPAYLGFVFADRTATNITIKTGFWALGRTFWQAAFLGVSYDQNVLFLAQAPGPAMDQIVVKKVGRDDTTLASNPIESFVKTWSKHWTALDDYEGPHRSSDPSTETSTSPTPDPPSKNPGLSTGAKAGIAIGAVTGVALLALAGFFLWWRRRNTAGPAAHQPLDDGRDATPAGDDNHTHPSVSGWNSSANSPGTATAVEMEQQRNVHETGAPLRHEMEVKELVHEAPDFEDGDEMRRVVVTGLGAITPLGVGIHRTWQRLLASESGLVSLVGRGRDATEQAQWRDLTSTVAGIVPTASSLSSPLLTKGGGVPRVDDGLWRPSDWLTPTEERRMSLFTQYAVAAAEMALRDAGWQPGSCSDEEREMAGVCLGSGIGNLEDVYATSVAFDRGKVSPLFVPKILINLAAGHIAMRYGLRGPNHAATTACTTGAHSIGDAARFIAFGDADVMIAGGAESCIHPLTFAGFGRSRSLSTVYNDDPQGSCRPFDANRAGFVVAEGAAVVVLEELEHAKRRGARILAELKGYGCSGDAHHMTAPREDGSGAFSAMKKALKNAGVKPGQVDYINAHATGTQVGDAAEAAAIRSLMTEADGVDDESKVTVSSTKGAIGHLLGAAGAIEAVFSIMAIKEPDVGARFNYVPLQAQDKKVRVAVSNSFGFGGTNASLVFSELK